jgi:hypothetical protein
MRLCDAISPTVRCGLERGKAQRVCSEDVQSLAIEYPQTVIGIWLLFGRLESSSQWHVLLLRGIICYQANEDQPSSAAFP